MQSVLLVVTVRTASFIVSVVTALTVILSLDSASVRPAGRDSLANTVRYYTAASFFDECHSRERTTGSGNTKHVTGRLSRQGLDPLKSFLNFTLARSATAPSYNMALITTSIKSNKSLLTFNVWLHYFLFRLL